MKNKFLHHGRQLIRATFSDTNTQTCCISITEAKMKYIAELERNKEEFLLPVKEKTNKQTTFRQGKGTQSRDLLFHFSTSFLEYQLYWNVLAYLMSTYSFIRTQLNHCLFFEVFSDCILMRNYSLSIVSLFPKHPFRKVPIKSHCTYLYTWL